MPNKRDTGQAIRRFCRRGIAVGMSLGCAVTVSSIACATEAYIEADSFSYSESMTLDGALEGLSQGSEFFSGGEYSLTHNQLSVGMRGGFSSDGMFKELNKGQWDLSMFSRYDYFVNYSPDTAEIYYASEAEIPIESGSYNVDLRLERLLAYGVRAGYRHKFTNNISGFINIAGLTSSQLLRGGVSGNLTIADDDDIQGALALDYHYDDDLLFDRTVNAPTGLGATIDFGFDWQITPKLNVSIESQDVWSHIRWKNAPRTIADATTSITRTDANGLLVVRPTLAGVHSETTYTQRYEPRNYVQGTYQITDKIDVGQTLFNIDEVWLTKSRVGYAASENWYIEGEFEWETGALGGGVRWRELYIKLTSDRLDLKNARYLEARVGLVQKF